MKKISFLLAIMLAGIFQLHTAQAQETAPGTDIIGFGYNVFGEYANQRSKMPYCLFQYKNFTEQTIGNRRYKVPQRVLFENISEHVVKTVSGESIREYATSLAAEIGLEFDGMLFSGTVNTNYSQSSSGSEEKYYFTYMDANTKWRISLDTRNMDALKTMLDPDFKRDIDQMNPSLLFETYGTHYIARAYLGGRADYNSVSTITESTNKRDIEVAVTAKYKAVSGNAKLNTSHESTLKNAKTETRLRVVGGNSEYANTISDPATYEKWASGLAEMPVLCDFDKNSLRPIWEFASSERRKRELELEFEKLLKKHPLPAEIAQTIRFNNKFFYIKNKADNLFMDMKGYHFYAEAKGGKVTLFEKDNREAGLQGADRFIKIITHNIDPSFVFFQPQHSDFVFDITGGVKTAGAELQLWDQGNNNRGQMFTLEPVSGEKGTFLIKNANSGLYLTGNGKKPITQEALTNANNQKWIFETANPYVEMAPPADERYAIMNVMGKRYIDLPGGGKDAERKGGQLQLWDMDHAPDRYIWLQKTNVDNFFVIQHMHSQHVWDVQAKSNDNGARIHLWDQHNENNQHFRFEFAGEPMTYNIINRKSGKYVDASNTKIGANGCHIQQWEKTGKDNQKWKLTMIPKWNMPPQDQLFHIKTAYANKYIDLPGTGAATNENGKGFTIWDLDGGGDRIFKFIPSGDNSWVFIEVQNGGRFMAIPSNSNNKGTQAILYDKTNGNDQKFAIMPTSPTNFAIRTKNWKNLDVEGAEIGTNGKKIHQWDAHFGPSQQFQLIYADGPNKGKPFKFF